MSPVSMPIASGRTVASTSPQSVADPPPARAMHSAIESTESGSVVPTDDGDGVRTAGLVEEEGNGLGLEWAVDRQGHDGEGVGGRANRIDGQRWTQDGRRRMVERGMDASRDATAQA